MFVALGGTLRLLLPASVFAAKINPGSRDLALHPLALRLSVSPITNPKSRVSARVPKK